MDNHLQLRGAGHVDGKARAVLAGVVVVTDVVARFPGALEFDDEPVETVVGTDADIGGAQLAVAIAEFLGRLGACLLYTSDAADE